MMLNVLFLLQQRKTEETELILLLLSRLDMSLSKCFFFFVIVKMLSIVCLHQRVAVLHLEEKCERAIDWAMKLEPSIKHMVSFDSNNERKKKPLSTKHFFDLYR